ncbi:dehydrogenase [Agrobacterium rhizogenes]|nr:dehydrogenase [Rhizobium rhizogenes]NTJ83382.1 dehydrogenase [Rhizobium rhizogenes]
MKLIKILMLASLPLVLPACVVSTRSDSLAVPPPPPSLAKPDSALTMDCDLPVDIGKTQLPQAKTEKFWIQDRKSLLDCRRSKAALRDFYADRDRRLENQK